MSKVVRENIMKVRNNGKIEQWVGDPSEVGMVSLEEMKG